MNILFLGLLTLCAVAATSLGADFTPPDGDYIKQKLKEYNDRMNSRVYKIQGNPVKKLFGAVPQPTEVKTSGEEHHMSISEINMNGSMAEYLYQGDILLTRAQADLFLSSNEDRQKRQSAVPGVSLQLWPRNISYVFDAKFARTVMYFDHYNGCFTTLGMGNESQHLVSLGPNCDQMGIAIHEIGHALGLYHTQARHDRDEYVTVHFENIWSNWTAQFGKQLPLTNDNLGIPYDYGSVMHYDQTSPQNHPKIALLANDKLAQYNMGSYLDSFYDILMINKLYKCTDDCASSLTVCANSGYPNPNDCSTCICPSGFGGRLCNEMPEGGTEILLTLGEKTCPIVVNNTVVADDTRYTKHYYWIKAPENNKVKITYKYARSNWSPLCIDGCPWVGIEIKAGKDKAMTGYRFCCSDERVVVSNSSFVPIIVYYIEKMRRDFSFCAEIVEEVTSITTSARPTTTQFTITQPATTTITSTTLTTDSTDGSCWTRFLNQTMKNGHSWSFGAKDIVSATPPGIVAEVHIYHACSNGIAFLKHCKVSGVSEVVPAMDVLHWKGKNFLCTWDAMAEIITRYPSTTTATLPPTTTSTPTRQPTTTTTTRTLPTPVTLPSDGSCFDTKGEKRQNEESWRFQDKDIESATPPGLSAKVHIYHECNNGTVLLMLCRVLRVSNIEPKETLDWKGKSFRCSFDGLVEISSTTSSAPSTTTTTQPTTIPADGSCIDTKGEKRPNVYALWNGKDITVPRQKRSIRKRAEMRREWNGLCRTITRRKMNNNSI